MASEMWERLRAARRGANLTQMQIAKRLGITRAGYAFHETAHADSRTMPNVEQIKIIASMVGVPPEVLMNDALDVTDVIRMQVGGDQAAPPTLAKPEGLLMGAVRFAVSAIDPARLEGFSPELFLGPLDLGIGYMMGRTCAVVLEEPSPTQALDGVGRLVLAEKVLGRPLNKLLVVWSRGQADLSDLANAAVTATGVLVRAVTTPDEAARALLSGR